MRAVARAYAWAGPGVLSVAAIAWKRCGGQWPAAVIGEAYASNQT